MELRYAINNSSNTAEVSHNQGSQKPEGNSGIVNITALANKNQHSATSAGCHRSDNTNSY